MLPRDLTGCAPDLDSVFPNTFLKKLSFLVISNKCTKLETDKFEIKQHRN